MAGSLAGREPPVFEYAGLSYRTHEEVYQPEDDTWLLVDLIQGLSLQGKLVLEVGCGAGLALLAAVKNGARGVGTDRNPWAVRLLRENARLNALGPRVQAVRADLLTGLDLGTVDLVVFNPPYLPTTPEERVRGELNHAFDGGVSGDAVIDRFLGHLEARHATGAPVPETVLVLSNHNDAGRVHRGLEALGLSRVQQTGKRRYLFHQVWAERFSPSG